MQEPANMPALRTCQLLARKPIPVSAYNVEAKHVHGLQESIVYQFQSIYSIESAMSIEEDGGAVPTH